MISGMPVVGVENSIELDGIEQPIDGFNNFQAILLRRAFAYVQRSRNEIILNVDDEESADGPYHLKTG